MRLSEAVFNLTRNEWNTAINSDYYQFHLWLLNEKQPKLFIVPHMDLEPHVPMDRKSGQWQSAQMYFRDFKGFDWPLPKQLIEFVQNEIKLTVMAYQTFPIEARS